MLLNTAAVLLPWLVLGLIVSVLLILAGLVSRLGSWMAGRRDVRRACRRGSRYYVTSFSNHRGY